MKRLLLLFCFITLSSQAQILDIPDANFKAKLLEASPLNGIARDISGYGIAIDTNNDGEIQESEALEIFYLTCNFSNISNITGLEYFVNLKGISLVYNDLSVLPLDTLTNLEYLRCDYNEITDIDFTDLINLTDVSCSNNQIVSLDFSDNPNFSLLFCGNNTPLNNINVKNGLEDLGVDVDWYQGTPNLEFVCADFGEIMNAQSNVNYSPTVAVSSYCSFTPGGNFNTISGHILFDTSNDGCTIGALPINGVNLSITDGTNLQGFVSSLSGSYSFYTQAGDFEITPSTENPSWFDISPDSANVLFLDNLNNVQIQDFCISPIGVHNDVEVTVTPLTWARPGYNSSYKIVYRNRGNQVMSGDLNLNFDDTTLDFLSASVNPDGINFGSLSWDYSNLTPFESRFILIDFDLNAPTDSPPLNQGDVLSFSTIINPTAGDEVPANNTFDLEQELVNAYDPNDITCLEGDIVAPEMIGEYLHYNVRFENTGTAAATFVVVRDEIDETMFDLNTFQIIHASHDMTSRITDNLVEFIFDDINLEPEGMGNVVFKIKTRSNLNIGDSVAQQANIYFDFNFPIETNVATTTFQEPLSVNEFTQNNAVNVYPNPTSGQAFIDSNYPIQSLELYDIQGRKVQVFTISEEQAIDLTITSKGVYFLRIQTDKGTEIEKLIKN